MFDLLNKRGDLHGGYFPDNAPIDICITMNKAIPHANYFAPLHFRVLSLKRLTHMTCRFTDNFNGANGRIAKQVFFCEEIIELLPLDTPQKASRRI